MKVSYDAVVVGSGPNGLAAAIRLAQAGWSVLVAEAGETPGGGLRSAELTLPGFMHDICSAVHPMAAGSPFLRTLPLEQHGVNWIQPEVPLAHPLDDGTATVLERSVRATAQGLGRDGAAYERLAGPLAANWEALAGELLQPLAHWPRHPWLLARFGLRAVRSATGLARAWFAGDPARALLAGLAAHSFLPLEQSPAAAYGLVLAAAAHALGWPFPQGGAQRLADALAACLRGLGGELATRLRVESLDQLPLARAVVLDLTPRQVLRLAAHKLPLHYRQRLERFRYGPGVFKIDYALDWPIPWRAATCARAGTVHLGGSLEDIAASERAVAQGQVPERPFVILSQPTLFDPSRAPEGCHVAWAYCHVPNDSTVDMTERIESQIERFAPGFRGRILARRAMNTQAFEQHNPNLVGGDIAGGAADWRQMLARPVLSPTPYRTPTPGLYLCSASTPPGGGVHGMCGFHAAQAVLRDFAKCALGSPER